MRVKCVLENTILKQKTLGKIKYQDIIYYKDDRDESITPFEEKPVDFILAMSEMEKLDWTFKNNRIGFCKRYGDSILFFRLAESMWQVQVPLFYGENWSGYVLIAYLDSKSVSNMTRLFFEDMDWFGAIKWRQKYHGKLC